MTKVIVLTGGDSAEREVSLRSGAAVTEALRKLRYDVTTLDTSCNDKELRAGDVVFPVLHGKGGEDGQIQQRLEKAGLAYVGSGVAASRLCMDKGSYRTSMIAAGFLMAQGDIMTATDYATAAIAKKPHVIKPIDGGSSIDTHIIRTVEDKDDRAIARSFSRHYRMIVEELIVGTEVTVGILGQQSLPIIEIIPPAQGEFDFQNKYNGMTQELIPPLHVTDMQQNQVRDIALAVHTKAGCRDFSRSDFIITPVGDCYLLETNTIPGMTNQSLFPKMAAAIGIDMPSLCETLVGFALQRGSTGMVTSR